MIIDNKIIKQNHKRLKKTLNETRLVQLLFISSQLNMAVASRQPNDV